MPTNKEIMETWLHAISNKRYELWPELLAENVVAKFPLIDESLAPPLHGYEQVRATIFHTTTQFESWDWIDMRTFQTDDPDFVITMAKSRARTVWGMPYENTYVLTGRIVEGKITEFTEYFDPNRAAELIMQGQANPTA